MNGSHIFWANESAPGFGGGTIGRANLDGSNVIPEFIGTDAVLPCGVAVDAVHIYWANGGGNTIGRAGLDGSGAENSFSTGANWPCGVAVDDAHLYWANSAAGGSRTNEPAIGRANLDSSGVDQVFVTGILGVCGVALDP